MKTVFRLKATTFGASVHTPILYQDHLFGVRQDGQLVCLDSTGKLAWESGAANQFGNGPFLMAQGMIFVMNDDGQLTLADGRLILRDLHQMVCLDVAGK